MMNFPAYWKERKTAFEETIINRSSGSSFDQWLSAGACEIEDPEELRTLAAHSVPSFQKYRLPVEKGILKLDALLEMLEVRLIELYAEK